MRIAIIGSAGHWHYALQELPHHTLVGIAPGFAGEDMTPVVRMLAQQGIEATVEVDPLGFLDRVDLIIINTRFDRNAELTIAYLEKNVYVFCEKPLALTLEQLARVEAANRASAACVVGMFGLRGEPWFVTLREAVKALGKIRLINGQKSYRMGRRPEYYCHRESFGGIIPWVAIHAIDWALALCEGAPIRKARGLSNADDNCGHGEMDITSLCQFELEGGVLVSVSADFLRPNASLTHDDDRLRVVCTEGIVEYQKGRVSVIDQNGERELPLCPAEDIFAQFLRRIGGETTGVTPEESFAATRAALLTRDDAWKTAL